MKKRLLFAFAVVGALALVAQPPGGRGPRGGLGPGFVPQPRLMIAGPASRTPVTGAPYSAVETTQFEQTLAGGNQISRQQDVKVFRDSQGRVRTERTFTRQGSTMSRTMISIFDPVAGYSYLLDPSKSTAVKISLPPSHAAQMGRQRSPRANAAARQTDNLGTQTVNGVNATGTRTTETLAAGAIGNAQPIQIVREVWVSNDLKVPVMIRSSDPRFGNTVMQLTNIVQAEPDASLFLVPSSYTISARPERQ